MTDQPPRPRPRTMQEAHAELHEALRAVGQEIAAHAPFTLAQAAAALERAMRVGRRR